MRKPVVKSIAIIGEGETEWFYFESLRVACRYPFKVAPDFPRHSDVKHMVKLVDDCFDKGYDHIVCLFDMDRFLQIPSEMKQYQQAIKKYRNGRYRDRVLIIETNPCTEFWFLLHFLPNLVCKQYQNYNQLIPELQKHMPGYEKTKKYFIRTNLYKYLKENGDIKRAINNSKKIHKLSLDSPEDAIAYSEIHKVFTLLETLDSTN